jgi:hypothetical protein
MISGGLTLGVAPRLIIGIDWKSFEHHAAFIDTEEYDSFMAGFSQVFDLKVAAPLTSITDPNVLLLV